MKRQSTPKNANSRKKNNFNVQQNVFSCAGFSDLQMILDIYERTECAECTQNLS